MGSVHMGGRDEERIQMSDLLEWLFFLSQRSCMSDMFTFSLLNTLKDFDSRYLNKYILRRTHDFLEQRELLVKYI